METAARKVQPWLIAYAVLFILRFFLTSHDEIIPDYADSSNYAAATEHDTWFHDERGGVAWLAQLARGLGLPYKLALDSVFLTLCFLAARRVARGADSEPLGLVCFFLLAFSSYFFRASLSFLSEPATNCLILAAALIFGHFLDRPVTEWRLCDALYGGIVLGLWVICRPEEMVIAAGVGALAVLAFVANRYYWRAGWSWRALILLLPLLCMYGSLASVRHLNYTRHHVAAVSRYTGPGMLALINALYSIPPPDAEIRYCPVTRGTFALAARVSPTLRPLLPPLIDPQNTFRLYASQRYHVADEVCTFLNFLLVDVYERTYSVENGDADKAMLQCAREIRAAQASGTLGRRTALFPIDPLWREWLVDLPKTLPWGAWNCLGLHYDVTSMDADESLRTRLLPLTDERNFTDGLLLRTALNTAEQLDVSGVLNKTLTPSHADYVLLRDGENVIGGSCVHPFTDFGNHTQFDIVVYPSRALSEVSIEFWKGTGLLQSETLKVPYSTSSYALQPDETWSLAARKDAWKPGLALRLRSALLRVNDLVLICGLFTCLGLAYFRSQSAFINPAPLLGLVAASACFVLLRLVFYSLLDVWVKWDTLRYLGASSTVSLFGLVIVTVLIGIWLGGRGREKNGHS